MKFPTIPLSLKLLIIIYVISMSAGVLLWFVWSHPRVGVDWAHHRYMLRPGEERPIIPPPVAGAGEIWYLAPNRKIWI